MAYYFDMDGTLSIFKDETDTPFADRDINKYGNHYFQKLLPDDNMLTVLGKLIADGNECYVISHGSNDPRLLLEHLHDKSVWLHEHCPELDPAHILWIPCQTISKADAVYITKNVRITEKDILIDDFNGNLTAWENAGGCAIKRINNLNNPDSFHGILFTQEMSVDEMYEKLRYLGCDAGENCE